MRALTVISLMLAALVFAPAAAFAQSEDEKILQPEPAPAAEGTTSEAPRKQSREDDELDDEDLDERVFYSGYGLARAESDFINLGAATNIEAVMGFRIPTVPWFGIELDIAQTIIPGENSEEVQPAQNCGGLLEPPCPGATGDPDEFAMQGLGISAAFKSPGRLYVSAKYGYRYAYTSIEELNEKRSSNGFGIGFGYRWGRGLSGVELGYKKLAEDIDAIGLTFFVRSSRR